MHPEASRALFNEEIRRIPSFLLANRGWSLRTTVHPTLDIAFSAAGRVTLRLRMTCDDWNELPPSIELLMDDGAPRLKPPTGREGVFHPGPHPKTGKPFICMAGSREYHTHPSHLKDEWESRRGVDSFSLFGIVTQVWRAWCKSTD